MVVWAAFVAWKSKG
jgi:hypothetical protein